MDVEALDFAVTVVPSTGAAQSLSNASTTQPAAAPPAHDAPPSSLPARAYAAHGFFFVDRTYRGMQ